MPAARMAVISESAARRERPRRMPTRTAHGDGDDEGFGEEVGDQMDCVRDRGGVADDDLQDLREAAGEEDEGEEDAAEQGVG